MIPVADIWNTVRKGLTDDSGWYFRRLGAESSRALFAAIHQPEGRPALLLEVPASSIPHTTEYPRSRGFTLFPEMIRPGPDGVVRLCLSLAETRYEDVFSVLVEDVASAIMATQTDQDAVEALLCRLGIWQMFMRRQDSQTLSREAMIGMYGELVVVERLLDWDIPLRRLMRAWVGPEDGVRDFAFPSTSIEVKTTSRLPPSAVRATTLGQLDERSVRRLYLCHVALGPAAQSGRTLSQLVASIRAKAKESDRAATQAFEDRLLQAGYLEAHLPAADEPFRVDAIGFFRVAGQFPRITPIDVRAGIDDCNYSIQVSALAPFSVSEDEVAATLFSEET